MSPDALARPLCAPATDGSMAAADYSMRTRARARFRRWSDMRCAITATLAIAISLTPLSPAAEAQTPPAGALATVTRCSLRAYYADKRPYESPHSDPFYAALIGEDLGIIADLHHRVRRLHAAARLIIRTDTGNYEEIIGRPGAAEFTLPTHESVTAAWVDAVATPDGSFESCDPSGAFFVDGFHDVAFTKLFHLEESGARYVIGKATHLPDFILLPLEPLATIRNPGRRPAGSAVVVAAPCNEPERGARPVSDVTVAFDEPAGADGPPSLLVDVSPLGSVMSVDINRPSGSHAVDVAMLNAAATQRFTPARWHCMNVPDRVIVPVWFSSRSATSGTNVPLP